MNLTPQWSLTVNLAYTERAPKDYELFANGPHVATAAWELGDPTWPRRSRPASTSARNGSRAPKNAKVNVYLTRFRNYIGLAATGNRRDSEGNINPGPIETAEGLLFPERWTNSSTAACAPASAASRPAATCACSATMASPAGDESTLDLEWRGDLVRANNTDTGEPLPRISPARVGATLAWGNGPWGARLGFDHYAAQRRVPWPAARDRCLHLVERRHHLPHEGRSAPTSLWYARIDNLTNKLAYSATSILTTTAFPDAPLPGRSLRWGCGRASDRG